MCSQLHGPPPKAIAVPVEAGMLPKRCSRVVSGWRERSAGTQDVSEQIHEALLKTLGKAKRELDQFDMASKMREKGLEQIFEAETWPAIGAVRELATKIRKRTANGVEPFVFADLRKWARASAATHLCSWSALCGQVPPHICARVCAGAA